jgi:hypothetical protein
LMIACQILMRLAYEVKVWLWTQGNLGVVGHDRAREVDDV